VELLLNIVWFGLASAAVIVLLRRRGDIACQSQRFSSYKALLALGCVIVLLFPVISASDDLHPSQALLEDSSKRSQHAAAAVIHPNTAPDCALLIGVLTMLALFGPMFSRTQMAAVLAPRALTGVQNAIAGRAPPLSC
jgi:hypothetical protein